MAKNPMPYDFGTTITYVGASGLAPEREPLRCKMCKWLYEPATERILAPFFARLKEIADELDG